MVLYNMAVDSMHIAPATIVSMGPPQGLGVICTPGGCIQVAVLLRSALVALSGIVGVLATLSYLSDARDAYLEERRRVRAEADALESFTDRVRGLTSDQPATASPGTPIAIASQSTTGSDVTSVCDAYRETVMAVDHYAEDYDEPLPEHMQSEFGPDLTNAVLSGGPLPPGLQQGLVAAAETGIREREAFLEELATEFDALSESAEPLKSIEAALTEIEGEPRIAEFDELADRWSQLDRLEAACTEVVDDRRASLAKRDAFDLAAYLYSSVGPPYPVLAAAAALAGDVREERRRTADMLTRVV